MSPFHVAEPDSLLCAPDERDQELSLLRLAVLAGFEVISPMASVFACHPDDHFGLGEVVVADYAYRGTFAEVFYEASMRDCDFVAAAPDP